MLLGGKGKITENERLNEIFGRFVGVELPTEGYVYKSSRGKEYPMKKFSEEGGKLYSEIYNVAAENNINNLRVWAPGLGGTCDVQMGRLNLKIEENDNGKWIVKDEYYYG